MKNTLRLLSILAALSLGAFAVASDKKADDKCCKETPACCKDGKDAKSDKSAKDDCCKDEGKSEKKPEKK